VTKLVLKKNLMALTTLACAFAANGAPVLQRTDFIPDATRSHFSGFESIPNNGTFYTGGSGPYVEDGIRVRQVNGDPGNDIWIHCSCGVFEGNNAWYPNGGGSGYTEISMADGSQFIDFGFYAGTGSLQRRVYFDLLLEGVSVLSGSTATPTLSSFEYIGFSGGGYDTIRIRDPWWGGTNVYDGHTTLTLDALETRSAQIPEPATLALIGTAFVALGFARRRTTSPR
jgi:PEP-CTERM motif-containing protein